MRYLLVNHIAATPGRDAAHVSLPSDWARDLAAAGSAAIAAHVHLIVATPLEPRPRTPGPRVDVVPDAVGFEHLPIPGYRSARAFLANRAALRDALARAADAADAVQVDHGGYPVPLGIIAARAAATARKRTIWMLGGDALPTSRLRTAAGTSTRRLVGGRLDSRIGDDLYAAMRAVTRVVASRRPVVDALLNKHGISATLVDSLDLLDADVATARAVSARHARLLDGDRPLRVVSVGPHTVARGTAALVGAIQHARRLHVQVELTIAGDGGELPMLRKLVNELDLGRAVRFEPDADAALAAADVIVESAEDESREASVVRAMAGGVVPIVAASTRDESPARRIDPAGGVAGAIVDAAVRRAATAATMLAGVEWCRSRTIESSYRKRFALAAGTARRRTKHAA